MENEAKKRSDRVTVWLGIVGTLVTVFGGINAWQAQRLAERQEAFNQTVEKVRQAGDEMRLDMEARQLSLNEDGAIAAAAAAKVNQGQLLTGLIEPLVGEDRKRQRIAIEIVLKAVPDGQQLVKILEEWSADPQTQKAATEGLSDRRKELVEGLFSQTSEVRGRSASELWSWAGDDVAMLALVNYAASHLDNQKGVYNTLTVLLRASQSGLEQNCEGLKQILATAKAIGSTSAAWAKQISARAPKCSGEK